MRSLGLSSQISCWISGAGGPCSVYHISPSLTVPPGCHPSSPWSVPLVHMTKSATSQPCLRLHPVHAHALSMPAPCPCPHPVHARALSMPCPVHACALSMPVPCPCLHPVHARTLSMPMPSPCMSWVSHSQNQVVSGNARMEKNSKNSMWVMFMMMGRSYCRSADGPECGGEGPLVAGDHKQQTLDLT